MKFLSVLIFSFLPVNAFAESPREQKLQGEAQRHIEEFGKALKKKLTTSMQKDGPVAAIEVCNESAPAIANSLSQNGWQVGRTALKVRNPNNTPDAWEQETLNYFAEQLAEGVKANQLKAYKTENGKFRYMQAIPTGGVCLTCHGDNIAADIQQKVSTIYPNDNATGFSLGQLRGAFTLSKKL